MTALACHGPSLQVFYDPLVLEHNSGSRNPESPARVLAILEAIGPTLAPNTTIVRPNRAALWNDLRRCHDEHHLQQLRREALTQGSTSKGGVPVGAGSWRAALHAAGSVLSAVDWALTESSRRALCVVRPPGHHAGSTYSHGFCLLNNVAIAARYAQSLAAVDSVLIVDWDAHHGNGTQEIFWRDATVGLVDVHRHPWHMGTGAEDECGAGLGLGRTINLPVERNACGATVTVALSEALDAAAEAVRPDLVFISCGFDALADDPAGGLRLAPSDFGVMTDAVVRISEQHSHGRLVSVLEGGYLNPTLGAAARAHVDGLRRELDHDEASCPTLS